MLGLLLLALRPSGSSASVERHRLQIAEVVAGDFQELAAVNARVEPEHSIAIPAIEGGRIDALFVEDGAMVEAGQPLMRLSNATLMLDFMNRETQIIEQINNLRNTRITINQNKRTDTETLMQVNYELTRIERQFALDIALFTSEFIAEKDFNDSRDEYEYLRARRQFLEESVEQDRQYRALQLKRIDASIELMERNLEAIRQNLENLTVKAPVSGQLTGFDYVVGQTVAKGEPLGRVDGLNSFIASAQVDEHYLGRVEQGMEGSFQLNGQTHRVRVKKVLPTVANRTFEVEMAFQDTAVQVRRGQTLQITLEMSAQSEALLLPRGGFFKETAGKWAYVLTSENRAVKREIALGRQNTRHFEVLSGLEPGEHVIVSTYDAIGKNDYLEIE